MENKQGEYKQRGHYHKHLNPNWSYYPTYLAKKKYIHKILNGERRDSWILDAGAGEGVFIEELNKKSFLRVIGLDLNYSSGLVRKGNVLSMPFQDKYFDIVLMLDVLEHLNFDEQVKALQEVKRVLKDKGRIIVSVPNLAHFYSRLRFLIKGEFLRTANIKKHPGDRPAKEYVELLKQAGFVIQKRKGIFPTFPFLANLIWAKPSKTLWLYNILKVFALPDFCFLNIFICVKKNG